jgi:hypothetical protein
MCFKLNFLVGLAVQNIVWFVTKHFAAFVTPQTQKQLQNKHSLSQTREVNYFHSCVYIEKINSK